MVSFFSLFVSCNKTTTIPDVVGKWFVIVASDVAFSLSTNCSSFLFPHSPRSPSLLRINLAIQLLALFRLPTFYLYFVVVGPYFL